jgi:hypothetical protein
MRFDWEGPPYLLFGLVDLLNGLLPGGDDTGDPSVYVEHDEEREEEGAEGRVDDVILVIIVLAGSIILILLLPVPTYPERN